MISIRLGLLGSGKTVCAVRDMYMRKGSGEITFSNIITKLKNNIKLTPDMIISRSEIGKKRDGTPVLDLKPNMSFWQDAVKKYPQISVVIDEAHTIINARKSMSKANIIVTDWLALIRRIVGQSETGQGNLVLISQLSNRLDIIAREMATNVRYHVCWYEKYCTRCGITWTESNETPEPLWQCPNCGGYRIKKHHHRIEVWHFSSMKAYEAWKDFGMNTFHAHYVINDIELYFPLYNTIQWDNMFSEYY